jgi:peptidoglycan/xylan/chitin deacetylase (PgdA/CDA1 family)
VSWRALKHVGYRALSLTRPAHTPRPGQRALMYHSVGTALPDDPYGTGMALPRFKAHMESLAAGTGGPFPVPFAPAREGRSEVSVTFDDGYRDTLTTAAPVLARLSIPFTAFVTPAHVKSGSKLYLTRAQLKELAGMPGAVIGAHGDTHTPLDAKSDAALKAELEDSKKWLEDAVGMAVTSMSYPFGLTNRRVRDAAKAAGYTLAGCSLYGLNEPGRDPLMLRRTELTAWDTVSDLRLKLSGRWDWFASRQSDPLTS